MFALGSDLKSQEQAFQFEIYLIGMPWPKHTMTGNPYNVAFSLETLSV